MESAPVNKWSLLMLLLAGACVGCARKPRQAERDGPPKTVYDFTVQTIDGEELSLAVYKGKVAMIVNVCSFCRFTPQYEGLQKLYATYKDRGFVVLAFPGNNVFFQEPFSNQRIKRFATRKYGVTFPMFAKVAVWGSWKHPLYKHLTDRRTNPEFGGGVTWNFNKFLIGRDGKVANRFGSYTRPEEKAVVEAIEQALADNRGVR
jgi:glutathione peroxidase